MSKKDTKIEFEEITGANAKNIENSSVESLQVLFEKNKNSIFIGLGVIVLLGLGLFYYKAIFQPKAELAANDAMFNAQYHFEQDSFDLALNGNEGFLSVIDDHGNTKAGKLANYYAGICYFNLGNYDAAITHLKKYTTTDEVLGSLSIGVLADAQMEKGDTKSALANYKKAANFSKNEACAPYLLMKAGLAFESTGDKKEANKFFVKLKNEFPNSDMARDADKYIGRTSF